MVYGKERAEISRILNNTTCEYTCDSYDFVTIMTSILGLSSESLPSPCTTMSGIRHQRSLSSEASPPPRSPSPPSQTFHPSILPHSVPTPALVESVAGGAHYSGVRVNSDTQLKHHRTNSCHKSPAELNTNHRQVLEDLKELFCCRPTREIFDRSWNRDAVYEVRSLL